MTWPFTQADHCGATLGPHLGSRRGGVRPVEPLGERVEVARVCRSMPKIRDAEALRQPGGRHGWTEVPLTHSEARSGPPPGMVNTKSPGPCGRSAR
jgi:hypothetical protein